MPPKPMRRERSISACSQAEDQYTAYLKKWVTAYEKEARKAQADPHLLYNEKKYAEAMALGKEILAEEPENSE